MASSLPTAFHEIAREIMRREGSQCSDWRLQDKKGECELVIPKLSPEGFEITVVADEKEVTVYSEYLAHQHFTAEGDHGKVSEQAMGFVRDLLSPAMRIRLVKAGDKPVRGDFEFWRDGAWHRESITSLLSF
jgi:hypothetical protein